MGEPTLTSLAIELAELRKDIKAAFIRIDEQKTLAESVQKLATKVELQGRDLTDSVKNLTALANTVTELANAIKEMKEKPAKRWDAVLAQIISLVVAMLFGLIMAKLGLI